MPTIADLFKKFPDPTPTKVADWPDYASLPLPEDALLQLKGLARWEDEFDQGYGSFPPQIHALRTLSLLHPEHACEVLFDLLEAGAAIEDEDFSEEFMSCIAASGAPALPDLTAIFHSTLWPVSERHLVPEALEQMLELHPDLAASITTIFDDYLKSPSRLPSLNALVIAALPSLPSENFSRWITPIRELIGQDLVDIAFCGDLETIEISLGLRAERETPAPTFPMSLRDHYAEIEERERRAMIQAEAPAPNAHPVLRLFHLHRLYEPALAFRSPPALEGFLVSNLCHQDPEFLTDELFDAIAGYRGHSLPLEDRSPLLDTIRETSGYLSKAFAEGNFAPLIDQVPDDSGNTHPDPTSWLEGFERNFQLWRDLDHPVLETIYKQSLYFKASSAGLELTQDSPLDHFEHIIEQLYVWQNQARAQYEEGDYDLEDADDDFLPGSLSSGHYSPPAPVETVRRPDPKVGRNDPCPCGSGKKFKKCCGKN